jgi:hypothetical protein
MNRIKTLFGGAAIAASLVATLPVAPAVATTGPGCLRLHNVAANDVLNIRARPTASSRVVDVLIPGEHGIIAQQARCLPLNRPWGQRWCKVTHFNNDRAITGYVKARFVRDAECP